MGKRLIINADDFGLSEGVNYGIIKAYKEGIVNSTTIMANMPGFDHAVSLAKQHQDLKVGVHLTLTTYKPLLKTHKHIVKEDGYFKSQEEIATIDVEEAYMELKAQIQRVIDSGITIDHFDSHHHIHAQPSLKLVMERLYKEYNLPFRGGFKYATTIDRKTSSNISFYNEGVSLQKFKEILQTIQEEEVCELMCHPAYIDAFLNSITSYVYKRIEEVEILCSKRAKQLLQEEHIALVNYSTM